MKLSLKADEIIDTITMSILYLYAYVIPGREQPYRSKTYDYDAAAYTSALNPCTASESAYFEGIRLFPAHAGATSPTPIYDYAGLSSSNGTQTRMDVTGGLTYVYQLNNPSTFSPYHIGDGNITDYLDTNGVVVAHREFDPFGNTIVASGDKVNDFNFWFSSKYLDQETGLYYYGYRFYMPALGRWPSRDPIGEYAFWNQYSRWMTQSQRQMYIRQSFEPPYLFLLNRGPNEIDDLGTAHGNPVPPMVISPPVSPPSPPQADFGRDWSSYGHYCGAGTRPAGYTGAPVDLVDAACQRHDNCYAQHNVPSWNADPAKTCGKRLCDTALINGLDAVKNSVLTSTEARLYAEDAIFLFRILGGGEPPSQWEKCFCEEYRPVIQNPRR